MPHRSAESFLRAFRQAEAAGQSLEAIADDAEGFAAAMALTPESLAKAMDLAGDRAGGAASVPRDTFAAAACRRDGRIVAADEAFAAFDLPPRALAGALRVADGATPRISAIVDDARGLPVALAVAGPARALSWPMGSAVRTALTSGAADCAVLGVRPADRIDWARLFEAWTFSGAEARLAGALVRLGDLRAASADLGIAYETAREALASAMAKTGARRQPDFVRQLAQLAFGELPASEATWQTLADTYGLTLRQGRLALLIALGATRATAAEALSISDQSAKADLKTIYAQCGVESGAALGRIVAETDALARLASATDVEIQGLDRLATPLRFIRRRCEPGRIAIEDHGPLDGAPVVVFHTPLNGRGLPRGLVNAMQARGLRPIGVDRPGFGLTSETHGDFVSDANADLIDVLDALKLSRVRLLGRSVAMPLRFAAAFPSRVEFGVLLAATPPGTRPSQGPLGVFVGLALDHPELVRSFARMAARLSTEASIMRLSERAVKSSAADLAALADPVNRADWLRASRQSATGNGFAREFVLHADGGQMPTAAQSLDWTVLIGAQDTLGAGHAGPEQWRTLLPRGRIEVVPDGGRLLHLSHPDVVAAALARA